MAVLAVAAVGAWAGSALITGTVLGMSGAAIGWMAGSMLGNALFAPTQKSQGPRLNDLTVTGSAYGQPIPWVAGSPRIAGQVVWASPKREIATTESAGGKGGGGSEYTSYTYEVDLLILLTDNQLESVSRIWSNGELIYTARADTDSASRMASKSSEKWARLTVYTGASDQLPDPTYEAAVGTANAPAYRGRGSVFIQSLQLGGSGQIPNLTFELNASTASDYYATREAGVFSTFSEQVNSTTVASEIGPDFVKAGMTYVAGQGPAGAVSENIVLNWPATGGFRAEGYFYINNQGELFTIENIYSGIHLTFALGGQSYAAGSYNIQSPNGTGGGGWGSKAQEPVFDGHLAHWAAQQNAAGILNIYLDGILLATFDAGFGSGTLNQLTLPKNGPSTIVQWRSFVMPGVTNLGVYTTSAAPGPFDLWGLEEYGPLLTSTDTNPDKTLPEVVTALMLRAGYDASQFDVTPLSQAKLVRALANGSVSTARTLLEMLASTYQFEAVLSDKIYFRPRGGAPVATLTFDELGVMQDSTNPPDPLPLTQANELEIPAQLALTYNNVDGDYQTDTQYSDRLLTGMESTSAMQLPLGFTASEAKQIVDTMLLDKAVSALSTSITLDTSRAALQPTDVLLITGEDSSSYRMRIVKRTDAGGVTTLQCVADNASVLTQAGTTSGGTASQTSVAALATTTLVLMDFPALRDVDNLPGLYVAVTGSADNWRSAAVYDSLDNISYTAQSLITSQAPLGTCSTALGNWTGGNTFDETNTVTVNVGLQQLASVTYADILANTATNAALIGNELVQYRNATLVSAGVYTLSGLLRGRRGTDDAMASHVIGERFVALGSSGVRFLPLQSGDLARLRYYKGVSASQALSAVTAQPITPLGATLKPFAPVHPRANRDSADTVISWIRQTRLSTRIVGALPPSIPLGETSESYEVEVWTSGYTTLKRALASSTASVTYSNAMQVTDFGSAQAVLYVKIYQLSATVGRGKPLTASI